MPSTSPTPQEAQTLPKRRALPVVDARVRQAAARFGHRQSHQQRQRGETAEQAVRVEQREQVAGDGFDPAVRAELDGADHRVGDEEDEEQEGPEREAGEQADHDHEAAAGDPADGGVLEDAAEEQGEEVAGDRGAEDADRDRQVEARFTARSEDAVDGGLDLQRILAGARSISS